MELVDGIIEGLRSQYGYSLSRRHLAAEIETNFQRALGGPHDEAPRGARRFSGWARGARPARRRQTTYVLQGAE